NARLGHVAHARRRPTDGPDLEAVLGTILARPVARLGHVAHAVDAPAHGLGSQDAVGRTCGVRAAARLRDITDAARQSAGESRLGELVGRTLRARPVALLFLVAAPLARPTNLTVRQELVGGTRITGAVTHFRRIARPCGAPADDAVEGRVLAGASVARVAGARVVVVGARRTGGSCRTRISADVLVRAEPASAIAAFRASEAVRARSARAATAIDGGFVAVLHPVAARRRDGAGAGTAGARGGRRRGSRRRRRREGRRRDHRRTPAALVALPAPRAAAGSGWVTAFATRHDAIATLDVAVGSARLAAGETGGREPAALLDASPQDG